MSQFGAPAEQYDRFIAAKRAGQSTQQALQSIGEDPLASTTSPFPTRRTEHNFNPAGTAGGAGS